ncbi:MAG: peptide chain release factor 2 [Thermoanaerobacteraceae bacterium]|nr:peptide chain release factor 2 [Thermoanaerobacteraceae bacterium]
MAGKRKQLADFEAEMGQASFWDDSERAQRISQKVAALKDQLEQYDKLVEQAEEVEVLVELAQEDESLESEVVAALQALKRELEQVENAVLLSGPYDQNNAIVSLHPGAGGTESQDWAEMLFRMYQRWAERNGYQVEVLDLLMDDEAGIKSVTFLVKGTNAYGYLKAERGVHRLVRISPFDTSGRRHTSFASVDVVPEIDQNVEIEIDESDLKIDTYRAGGAGGQHVNKTDSAVRITHLPTGIVVQCQKERSQHSNRLTAMKILKAKLFEKRLREQEEEMAALRGEQKEIAWGSQIRSYIFHPYSLVKDHRTNVEVGNVDAVMDGKIEPFIYAYLQQAGKLEEQ